MEGLVHYLLLRLSFETILHGMCFLEKYKKLVLFLFSLVKDME